MIMLCTAIVSVCVCVCISKKLGRAKVFYHFFQINSWLLCSEDDDFVVRLELALRAVSRVAFFFRCILTFVPVCGCVALPFVLNVRMELDVWL